MHTNQAHLLLRTALGVLGLLLCAASPVQAQQVTVELSSGRSFTAAISEQTDDTHLWLRFDGASSSLLRPVEWGSVEAAWIDGEALTTAELREQAAQLATPAVVHVPRSREEVTLAEGPTQAEIAREALLETARARSVNFDAYLANWDGDVEMDGLELRLYPLDAGGYLIPVDGTLQVELIAPVYRNFDARPHGQGRALEQIGRWTRSVRVEDFGPNGTKLRLPFQAIHPEFDMDAGRMGLVHVRLAVPGAGTFEASHDPVRIRPFSPLRDDYQRVEHHRFFPSETTGRGQRATQ